MPTFRVHFEDGAILTVAANSPEAAANHARKEFPGAIVTKTKLDRSGGARMHLFKLIDLKGVK